MRRTSTGPAVLVSTAAMMLAALRPHVRALGPPDSIPMAWIFPDSEPWGTTCVHGGGLCATTAHLLFAATPADPLTVLVPGADVSFDRGVTWVQGSASAGAFETHVIPPANTSQVFTWNYATYGFGVAAPPAGLCVRPWVAAPPDQPAVARAAASAGTAADARSAAWVRGQLEPFCLNLTAAAVAPNVRTAITALLLFGNFSRLCSEAASGSTAGGRCRLMGHVAFDIGVAGVVTPADAIGEAAVDGGAWKPAGVATSLAKFDVLPDDPGATYQRWHWALDLPLAAGACVSRVCYRIRALDRVGLGEAMVKMDVASTTHPSGVALDNTTRCWDF